MKSFSIPTAFAMVVSICHGGRSSQSFGQAAKQPQGCDSPGYKSIPLDSDTIEQVARKKVEPVYPEEALQRGVQGLVMVKVLVNNRGDVVRACAFSGDELLRPAAEAAALKWKFGDSLNVQKTVSLDNGIAFYFVLDKRETEESLNSTLKKFGKINFAKSEYGSLSEIRGKRRLFIYTQNPTARDRIFLVIHEYSGLQIVDRPEEADYFVGYGTWQRRLEDFVSPLSVDRAHRSEPVTIEDMLVFTVTRESKTEEMHRRILLWGNKGGTKYPDSVKFDRIPRLITSLRANNT